MFARRVIFVVNLPLPEGDMTEAAAPQRDPAARAVLPHHHLGPDSHQVVTTAIQTVSHVMVSTVSTGDFSGARWFL